MFCSFSQIIGKLNKFQKFIDNVKIIFNAAVSYIPEFGDAAASPVGDAISPAGDAATHVGNVHLPA